MRKISKVEGIQFIVDETKTGVGASGKNWAHLYWYLSEELTPDFMTFGGKSGLSGFYSTLEHRLNEEALLYSQNLDIKNVLNYGLIWKGIEKFNLLHVQKDTSSFLKIELDRIGKEYGFTGSVRGYGTYLSFDCENVKTADSIQRWFLKSGMQVLKCGPRTLGLRPSLVLGTQDCALLRDSLSYYHPNHTD